MPIEISKEKVLESLGVAAKAAVTTPSAPTSLDSTTKVLSALDKPVVAKYVDRILARVIKPTEGEGLGGGQRVEQPRPLPSQPPAKQPALAPVKQMSGEQVVEYLQVFMGMQDENITLGQFVVWLEDNKAKLARVVDMAMKKV